MFSYFLTLYCFSVLIMKKWIFYFLLCVVVITNSHLFAQTSVNTGIQKTKNVSLAEYTLLKRQRLISQEYNYVLITVLINVFLFQTEIVLLLLRLLRAMFGQHKVTRVTLLKLMILLC